MTCKGSKELPLSEDLHTKYRPATLDEVVGHDRAVKDLRGVLEKRSSRALIFTGPSGVGKTTLARIVATEVGCKPANIIEVNAASNTGVDDMRDATENINYAPMGGGARMYIIDEAHMLSKAAWSSVLKPVEEPPKGVWWAFCTTETIKIPANIRTRCVAFDLKPVKKDVVFDVLAGIAKAEGYKTSEDVLYLIAEKSEGSVRAAINGLAQCRQCRDRKEAAEALSATSEEGEIIQLCRLLIKGGLTWPKAMAMIAPFKGQPSENLRMTVVGFMTTTLLTTKDEKAAVRGLAILSAFSTPYPSGATLYPLILSLGELFFTGD